LGFVETVDLVNEEDGPLTVEVSPVGYASHDSAEGLEVGFGGVSDDHSQGGLACSWRPSEDEGR
jgi:hypothetical protein